MKKLSILELYVSGFTRLALSSTKEFLITPNNIHSLLGTNGSGKSSLLELWTPLPPNSKDFSEDGVKRIKFRFGDDDYLSYSINNKHTLQKNNEVILDGVGIQMMTEYVKEYFNITPNTHRLMLGKVTMCGMSLQNRKEFITSISGIDFDYINKLYNGLKKQLRDNLGVVKYLNNNILAMKEYILSEEEVNKLTSEKEEIRRLLVKLHENKTIDTPLTSIEKPDMVKISKRLEAVIESMNEYNMDIDSIKSKYLLYTAMVDEYNIKVNDISTKLMTLNESNPSLVVSRMNELKNKIDTILENITLPKTYLKMIVENMEYSNRNDISEIIELCMSVGNETKDSIEINIENANSKLLELSNKQKQIDTDIDNTYTKISTYRSAMNGLSCPDCGFHFKEDSVSDIIKKLNLHIETTHAPKDSIVKEIESIKENLSDLDKKLKDKKRVDHLIAINKIDSDSCLSELNTYIDIYEFCIKLNREIDYYKELISYQSEYDIISSKDITAKDEEIVSLTAEYESLLENIKKNSSKIDEMKKIINNHDQMSLDMVIVDKYLVDVAKNRKYKIKSLINKASNQIIFELNNKLSKIETIIDKYNYMSKSTDDSIKELEKISKDIELLELLIKELSPSTGLIAESLKSFLLKYIKDVNDIISSVWSYDMEVLPYDVKELEKGISYRFPVKVNDQKPVPDINETSESMREMINIAFRLVSLKYMGLARYPLLIDEFGRSMDEIHLVKSYDLLESIAIENDIQMVVVAHIKAAYTRFKNFGVSIVSSLNLEDME